MITIPASGLDVAEAHSLTTPHAAQKVHAPDHPQRDAPVSSCCSRCIQGTRALGYRPCGFKWDCKCHAAQLPMWVVEVQGKIHAVSARSMSEAAEYTHEKYGFAPTRIARAGS